MKFQDIVLSILIIIVFGFLFSSSALTVKMQEIKEDWPLYRCNPMAMPFASFFGSDVWKILLIVLEIFKAI